MYAIVHVLNEMNDTQATVLDVVRSNESTRRFTFTGIKDSHQFVLASDFLTVDAAAEGSDDILTSVWRVRSLSGLGDAVPLDNGTWRRVEPRLTYAEARDYFLAAVRRAGNSRMLRDAVVHLVDENGFASNSAAFGDERAGFYTATMRALETAAAKYSDAVRNAVGAGGQRKPHTLARAIALCEFETERAEKAAAAAAAIAGVASGPPTSSASGADRAGVGAPHGAQALDALRVGAAPRCGTGATPVETGSAAAPPPRASLREVDPRDSAVALGASRAAKRGRIPPPPRAPAADL